MHRKTCIITLILILTIFTLNNKLFLHAQTPQKPIHNINTGKDYFTINEAINDPETLNGHTIFVEDGTYIETLTINKAIQLIGENKNNTVIDGNHTQNIIRITVNKAKIANFTLQNSGFGYSGIYIYQASQCNITDIIMTNCYYGIQLYNCNKSTIQTSIISNCQYGIRLYNSTENNILNITAMENENGIHLDESHKNTIQNNTVSSNTANGIYLYASSNNTISGNEIKANKARGIRLHNSFNNIISDNNITENHDGIHLYQSNSNIISTNTILNNTDGLWLAHSTQNIIHANTISFNKQYGLRLLNSTRTETFHNNFINNTIKNLEPPSNTSMLNTWDNLIEGNYWSDHQGIDTNKDGISDNPYQIDQRTWLGIYSEDGYPLMAPFQQVTIQLQHQTHTVQIITNSTLASAKYNFETEESKSITLEYINAQERGFTRICIPHELVSPPYTLTINGATLISNRTLRTNGTHTWIYIEYSNQENTSNIIITHTPTIISQPPLWTQWTFWGMITLFIIAATLLRLSYIYRKTIRNQRNLIQDYEKKLQKTGYLAIASELFKEDVKERESKITQFQQKYGIKIKPRNSIDDIIKNIRAKEKEKEK